MISIDINDDVVEHKPFKVYPDFEITLRLQNCAARNVDFICQKMCLFWFDSNSYDFMDILSMVYP